MREVIYPNQYRTTCECGVVFEYSDEDILHRIDELLPADLEPDIYEVVCPICGRIKKHNKFDRIGHNPPEPSKELLEMIDSILKEGKVK